METNEQKLQTVRQLMESRFGHDCIISLATCADNRCYVREMDAYYQDGAFYFVTAPESRKVDQMKKNPWVALAGEWFGAQGRAAILGDISDPANRTAFLKMKQEFQWFQEDDRQYPHPYSLLVRVDLIQAQLIDRDTIYSIRFHPFQAEISDADLYHKVNRIEQENVL